MARSETQSQSVNLQARDGNDGSSGRLVDAQTDQNGEETTSTGEKTRSECDECGGVLVTYTDEVRCGDCGLVHEEQRVDHGAEWRGCIARSEGETGQNLVRCNGGSRNPTVHDHGLGSEIGYDGGGNAQLSRMRKMNQRHKFESKAERNLGFAFGEVKRVTSALDLGYQVQERACSILRNAQEEGAFKGDTIEELVGGSVYAACRELSLARLPEEIAEVLRYTAADTQGDFGVSKAIQNAYGKLCRTLGLGIAPLKPADHIPRAAQELELDKETRAYALTLARHIEDAEGFVGTGRSPSGMAAGCIYYATQQVGSFISQTEVSEAANVSAKTSRDTYKDLDELDSLPPAPQPDEEESTTESASPEPASTSSSVEADQVEAESVEPAPAATETAGAGATDLQVEDGQAASVPSEATTSASNSVVAQADESTATASPHGGDQEMGYIQEELPGPRDDVDVEADPPMKEEPREGSPPSADEVSHRGASTEQTYLWEYDTRRSVSPESDSSPDATVAGADT